MKTIFALLAGLSIAHAAPIPMTSSSKAVSPLWGMFRSELGFRVDGRDSGWKISEGPEDNEKMLAIFKGPSEGREKPPIFTVRVDQNNSKQKSKDYVKSWLLFYDRLGIQVLGHQPFNHNGENGYVLDLLNTNLKTQSRQALYFRGTQVVVLTCSDETKVFNTSLPVCNKLIKSFNWEASPNPISIQK
jgi:hypothetical protein